MFVDIKDIENIDAIVVTHVILFVAASIAVDIISGAAKVQRLRGGAGQLALRDQESADMEFYIPSSGVKRAFSFANETYHAAKRLIERSASSRKIGAPASIISSKVYGDRRKKARIYRSIGSLSGKMYFTLSYYFGDRSPVTTGSITMTIGTGAITGFMFKYSRGYGPGLTHDSYTTYSDYSGNEFLTHDSLCPYYTSSVSSTPYTQTNEHRFPLNAVAMFFCADWPFTVMHPTQENMSTPSTAAANDWNYQQFAEDNSIATNDPLTPIVYNDVSLNLDWTKIQVFGTRYYMRFQNFNFVDVGVEVLFYKYIVDFDSVVDYASPTYYTSHLNIPWNSTTNGADLYCRRGRIKGYGTPQIQVIQRDRFILKAAPTSFAIANNTIYMANNLEKCAEVTKVYDVKNKYSIKRSVNQTSSPATEWKFCNTLYEHQNGVYCQIRAWPTRNMICTYSDLGSAGTYTIYNYTNFGLIGSSIPVTLSGSTGTAAAPSVNAVRTSSHVRPLVQFSITKKSFIMMDSPMLKGPFMS